MNVILMFQLLLLLLLLLLLWLLLLLLKWLLWLLLLLWFLLSLLLRDRVQGTVDDLHHELGSFTLQLAIKLSQLDDARLESQGSQVPGGVGFFADRRFRELSLVEDVEKQNGDGVGVR